MTTCENYGIYSHQQIWHEMKDGAGPSSQADAVAGWHALAGRLTAIRGYLDSAISAVQESQQGIAADAAVGAMVPLGAWMDEAQRLANGTRDRIDHQISGFTLARDSIPEVPPEPRGGGWREFPVIDSFTSSDQEADEAFNAEQERQARAVMMAYQTSTNERVGSVPQFASPPVGEPDLTIPTPSRSTIDGIPVGVGSGLGAGGVIPGSPTPLVSSSPPPNEVRGSEPAVPDAVSPAPTGQQGIGALGGPEHPGNRPAPTAPTVPTAPGGVPPVGPAATRPVAGTPVAGSSRVSGSSRADVVGRDGGAGMGRYGSLRGRGPGTGGVGSARGAGGFGPLGSPESAVARGAGAVGPAGAGRVGGAGTAGGMMPFGAMGAGRGGEDNERQRPSYLVEPDSNRLVGDLPPTAPPVIGEDPPDHDEPHRR